MKRHFSIVILFMAAFMSAYAQNVQLHYDLGKSLYNDLSNRESVTSTVEMFKPDKFGSTYMFIDFDYVSDGTIGAYWEISRELNVSKDKHWAAHVEYNGGVSTGETPAGYYGNRFQHAALAGPAWNIHSKDFNRTLGIQLMYKYYFANHHSDARAFNSVQLTETWGINFAQGLCTFSGFCDLWYSPYVNGKWILLSEPQFWVNLNKLKGMNDIHLSVGSECEVSNNFVWNDRGANNKFYAIPTIAAKWTF